MMYIEVANADAWYEHVKAILAKDTYGEARVQAPKNEDHGYRVTYVWDPCGVLLHFAQELKEG